MRWDSIHSESEHADMRLRDINKVLDQLMSGVDTLFRKVGCDPRPIREMLGGDAGITVKNVMIYLGQVRIVFCTVSGTLCVGVHDWQTNVSLFNSSSLIITDIANCGYQHP